MTYLYQGLRRQISLSRRKLTYSLRCFPHKSNLPSIPEKYSSILIDLNKNGIAVSSLDQLMISYTKQALSGFDRIFTQIEKYPQKIDHNYQNVPKSILEDEPDIIRWGLHEDLLALVENYIGLPIAYRGLTLRRDRANGKKDGTRQWHRDDEDAAILKFIIYLNDVDIHTGPFEYIPLRYSPPAWKIPFANRITDIEMEKFVQKIHWTPCVGPRGTVVIVDTCRLFHRGMVPRLNDRKAAFFCFNSFKPVNPQYCEPLFDRKSFLAQNCLSLRQVAALEYKY
jgi:hypothetical protein